MKFSIAIEDDTVPPPTENPTPAPAAEVPVADLQKVQAEGELVGSIQEVNDQNEEIKNLEEDTEVVSDIQEVLKGDEVSVEALRIARIGLEAIANRHGYRMRRVVATEDNQLTSLAYTLEDSKGFLVRAIEAIKRAIVTVCRKVFDMIKRFRDYLYRREREARWKKIDGSQKVKDPIVPLEIELAGWDDKITPQGNIQKFTRFIWEVADLFAFYQGRYENIRKYLNDALKASKDLDQVQVAQHLGAIRKDYEKMIKEGLSPLEKTLIADLPFGWTLTCNRSKDEDVMGLMDYTLAFTGQVGKFVTLPNVHALNNFQILHHTLEEEFERINEKIVKSSDSIRDTAEKIIDPAEVDLGKGMSLQQFEESCVTPFIMTYTRNINALATILAETSKQFMGNIDKFYDKSSFAIFEGYVPATSKKSDSDKD